MSNRPQPGREGQRPATDTASGDSRSAGRPIRVLVVEDHELLAQSMVYVMSQEGLDAIPVIRESLDDIMEVATKVQPAVVLLDLDLGAAGSALPLISDLLDLGACVVMVSGSTDQCRLAECVEQGAVGVVSKTEPVERLLGAVRQAAETGSAMSSDARHSLLAALRAQRAEESARLAQFDRLTPREQDVLMGLADGLSAAEIADAGFVSIFTVRGHVRSILSKLGVGSQLAAVAKAREAGWLP